MGVMSLSDAALWLEKGGGRENSKQLGGILARVLALRLLNFTMECPASCQLLPSQDLRLLSLSPSVHGFQMSSCWVYI